MWRCKRCGGEIKGVVDVYDDFDFTLDKKGKLGKFLSSTYDSVDELIKREYYGEDISYVCMVCDEESDVLENIAVWEED